MAEHHHDHGHHHNHHGTGNIKVAFFLNLAFTIIEIIGGLFTNSMAILSDALHDLGDSISLGLSWYFQKVSQKHKDKKYSYGYKRFSLVGALVNSVILFVGSIFILTETIPRIYNPQTPDALGMIWLAVLGVIINGAAVFRLKKGESINEKVVSLHLLEDVLGWVAVLIGAIVMYFYDLPIIDPLLSLGIACFILFNVFKNLKSVFKIIMQGVPQDTNQKKIKSFLEDLDGVENIHDLHIWSMDGQYNVLTVHIVTQENLQMEALVPLKQKIHKELKTYGINHATLEFETKDEKCVLEDC
ncbi:cation diffusion facilitator family transporter [Fulvivirga lutimaris]|uniref:cation diffusion facilitator family transporter n=1 Tax=Fulvivirga lutimaris TaxID=1819566 RepID=UPI0012BCD680|nr:cation diffusion facilitator family transporter [Fulvivirga lutimaris]MTI40194.1 cation transporter [Fulvivirga lutimaris]